MPLWQGRNRALACIELAGPPLGRPRGDCQPAKPRRKKFSGGNIVPFSVWMRNPLFRPPMKSSSISAREECRSMSRQAAGVLRTSVTPLPSFFLCDECRASYGRWRCASRYEAPAVQRCGGWQYMVIAKITLVPGKQDEMIAVLKESAADTQGCLSYIVAQNAADENTIWVTKTWDSMASHHASLSLPTVKSAVPCANAIVSNFQRITVTNP